MAWYYEILGKDEEVVETSEPVYETQFEAQMAGDLDRAIELYKEQFGIAREIGDRRGEARSMLNQAIALQGLGERNAADSRLQAALNIFECHALRKSNLSWRRWRYRRPTTRS